MQGSCLEQPQPSSRLELAQLDAMQAMASRSLPAQVFVIRVGQENLKYESQKPAIQESLPVLLCRECWFWRQKAQVDLEWLFLHWKKNAVMWRFTEKCLNLLTAGMKQGPRAVKSCSPENGTAAEQKFLEAGPTAFFLSEEELQQKQLLKLLELKTKISATHLGS